LIVDIVHYRNKRMILSQVFSVSDMCRYCCSSSPWSSDIVSGLRCQWLWYRWRTRAPQIRVLR